MNTPAHDQTVAFGIIPGEDVRPGDHIAYFWETEQEFDRDVQQRIRSLCAGT